jgi:SAM-dependent methyltransferase
MATANEYENRLDFYRDTISRWIPDRKATILVVGGGSNDRQVFDSLGFSNVTLTNVSSLVDRLARSDAALAAADAEDLPYADAAFEYTVVHAVLHHCKSPHRALLELYRVAAKATIFFESRDSLSMKIAEAVGLINNYELSAVAANNGIAGGVRDTAVPNYVYRWTEREVEKAISSYAPHAKHVFAYAHGFGTPCRGNEPLGLRAFVKRLLVFGYQAFVALVPSQQNLFACRIGKPVIPADLQPWVRLEEGALVFKQP